MQLRAEKKPYDKINKLAASTLLNLTAGMRFEGSLNVDMNDITMNMVPFPNMHFLLPSMSPLVGTNAPSGNVAGRPQRAIDRLFLDVMNRSHQLVSCDSLQSTSLACALLARGSITAADVSRNIGLLKGNMRMPYWNQEVRDWHRAGEHCSLEAKHVCVKRAHCLGKPRSCAILD